MIRRNLVVGIWHESHLCGFHLEHEFNVFGYRVSLDVEFCGDIGFYVPYVLVSDMSFVRTWMHGYSLCAESLAVHSHLQHIGVIASACVADGGHFVDVYA